MNLVNNMNR